MGMNDVTRKPSRSLAKNNNRTGLIYLHGSGTFHRAPAVVHTAWEVREVPEPWRSYQYRTRYLYNNAVATSR